jgi:Arc/MetJ family transcription regulator
MSTPPARIQPAAQRIDTIASVRLSLSAPLCKLSHTEAHMATNLAIDPDLLERALQVSGERTKKAAVTMALQEFIARRQQKRVLDLMGKLEWDQSYDYKAERSRK